MFLRRLILKNFQKHSNLQIDFVNGVNILYGTSDAGKSCIRRALEWIVQNENIDGIRKTGTKKTTVTLTLNNDIEIERVRSQSINRYIIRKDNDEQVFDAIGKSIPDEVKEILTIYPIEIDGEEIYLNSQPQIALPFLFDKSPSFRMKLFNKLTGNDLLDKLFGQFNKDILRIKRNIREETERFEKRAIELKEKKIQKEKAEAIYIRLKKRVENIKTIYEKYSKLLELNELKQINQYEIEKVEDYLKNVKFPQPNEIKQLREKIDQFQQLKDLKNRCEKVQVGLEKVRGQLNNLKPLSIDTATLKGKIERFDKIKSLYEKFSQNRGLFSQIQRNRKIVEKDTIKCMNDYKKLLKEAKVCPICKNEITENCLKDIIL